MKRCEWAANAGELDQQYHDDEWGVPCHDDNTLFEILTLEGAQAGLSWSTVLAKREGYRKAFHQFNINKIARMTDKDVERLVLNPDIIRHRGKIESTIGNAKAALNMIKAHGSLDAYLWSFVDGKTIINSPKTLNDVPSKTELSDRMSKQLKKDGFKFVGSTICYAFMQACGMVNDHTTDCFRYKETTR